MTQVVRRIALKLSTVIFALCYSQGPVSFGNKGKKKVSYLCFHGTCDLDCNTTESHAILLKCMYCSVTHTWGKFS